MKPLALTHPRTGDTILSGAVVGDVDRDGKPEVVFGSDTSANIFFNPGGFVNILNHNGSVKFRHSVGEVLGVVGHHIVDLGLRQAGETAVQGVEEFGLGHRAAPDAFAVDADSTLATEAVKAFHSVFWAVSAAWPALVSW